MTHAHVYAHGLRVMESGKIIRRKPKNLSLHPTITARGIHVARELGYELSEFVEHLMEASFQALDSIPKKQRSDRLQILLFDRRTVPPGGDAKKPLPKKERPK